MQFILDMTIEILQQTPVTLRSLLQGLSETWILQNEGEGTWSPHDIVGHLIHVGGRSVARVSADLALDTGLKNENSSAGVRFALDRHPSSQIGLDCFRQSAILK